MERVIAIDQPIRSKPCDMFIKSFTMARSRERAKAVGRIRMVRKKRDNSPSVRRNEETLCQGDKTCELPFG
jgi:hypothetical protein